MMTPEEFIKYTVRVLRCFDDDGVDQENIWWNASGKNWRSDPAEPIVFYIKCNDFFAWGCSDAEEITPDNISILEQCIVDMNALDDSLPEKQYHTGSWGGHLFCARSRGMRPQGACYRSIPRELWPLFDACGPPREKDFGNPVGSDGIELSILMHEQAEEKAKIETNQKEK